MSNKELWNESVKKFINDPKNGGKDAANGVFMAMITTLKAVLISKGMMTEEGFYNLCIDALDQNENNPPIPTPYAGL